MAKQRTDPQAEFRKMTREDQRLHILDIAKWCIDGAPVSLARKIEIYLEGEQHANL